MFAYLLLIVSFFFSSVFALPLRSRDVVAPPITSPTTGTIWHVGETPIVTWSTANLPQNQTNPVGKLILGYWYNNSENLMLDSPLATNIDYSVGQAQITVPDVPSRTDYIVVLFGDSGNASPQFTIINDKSTSVASSLAPTTPSGSTSFTAPDSASPTANPKSDNGPSSALSTGSSVTTTASISHTTSGAVPAATTTPSSSQSNAAWQKHSPSLGTSLGIALAVVYFAFS